MGAREGTEKIRLLSAMEIFAEAPEAVATVDRLAPMVTAQRGDRLSDPSRRGAGLHFIKRGHVRLYALDPSGHEATVAVLGMGHVFGEVGALAASPPELYADAMDDVALCTLRRGDLEELLRQEPRLGLRLLEALSGRIRDLEEQLVALALQDVRHRLLLLLARLAAAFGDPAGGWASIDFITHQEIATMIGSTRETVTATLSDLARSGAVRTGRRQMWVNTDVVARLLNAAGRPSR